MTFVHTSASNLDFCLCQNRSYHLLRREAQGGNTEACLWPAFRNERCGRHLTDQKEENVESVPGPQAFL